MKYFKRLNVYKASNVEFWPDSFRAYSYNWWRFVDTLEVNGHQLIVFNDYNYSPTTQRHQAKVRDVLNKLGLGIDLVVYSRSGLQSSSWKSEAAEHVEGEISELEAKLNNKRRHRRLDGERLKAVGELKIQRYELLKVLGLMNTGV